MTWWTRNDKEEPDLTDDEDGDTNNYELDELNKESDDITRKVSLDFEMDIKRKRSKR